MSRSGGMRLVSLIPPDLDIPAQICPVPYSPARRRREVSVKGHHPAEDLVKSLSLMMSTEIPYDLNEVFSFDGALIGLQPVKGRSYRLQQPETFLNSQPKITVRVELL